MLSQTCEYALRAATYIAQHGDGRPVLAKEIAKETAIPLKYLQKVLRDLVRTRLLTSSRGIGGGFRLSRPARQLRLEQVIAPFDDAVRRTSCPFGNPQCGQDTPCPVHHRWIRLVEQYNNFLQKTSLADLVSHGRKPAPRKRAKKKAGRAKKRR